MTVGKHWFVTDNDLIYFSSGERDVIDIYEPEEKKISLSEGSKNRSKLPRKTKLSLLRLEPKKFRESHPILER